jgi:protein involved in polysaccharide export with SLBB domain
LTISAFLTLGAFGQTREQIKAQAESALQKMTPDELEKKIKELGLTVEEATRRAREMNISLEDFLNRTQPAGNAPATAVPIQTSLDVPKTDLSKGVVPAATEYRLTAVPGFEGRVPPELALFGFEIFKGKSSTFEPVLNLPTPTSYVLGPGDEVVISVWGETKLNYQLQVNREGNIVISDVGPVMANGLTMQQLREVLIRRMTVIYSGLKNGRGDANTFLDVSVGKLRTIQIFVLGEVVSPGGYSLSSMSTSFHALYLSGGPTVRGSLRDVAVLREGKTLSRVDFYDYILKGDKSKDVRLQDGDIVFVHPSGKRIAVTGTVVRPGIYELKKGETLSNAVSLSGGLQFASYFKRVHVERIIPFAERKNREKDIVEIDLPFESQESLVFSRYELEDGDVVSILKISNLPENKVTITGSVKKPGPFQLQPQMRVRDLILAADSLARNTFTERGVLFRLLPNLKKEIISFNLAKALAGDGLENMLLVNEDSVVVYQESQFFPAHPVSIYGAVRSPGTFQRNEGMSVSDLIVIAGGIKEEGQVTGVSISRMDTIRVGVYSKVFTIDLPPRYWEEQPEKKFFLQDFDLVQISFNPRYSQPKIVQVAGYAMFPGTYAIQNREERLSSLLQRAGGTKPGAYLEGSTIFRKLNNAGIIPIDFRRAIEEPDSRDNVVLNEGDSISISFHEDVVYLRGELFTPSAVLYKKGASLHYYITQAGGYKEEADDSKTVVFLPGGKKWESSWFILPDPEILPGSSIFVPRKIEKEDKTLPILRDWATIMVSIATMMVAIVQVTK